MYKLRKDLHLNKPKEIESTFVEVIETKKKNVGYIYKHPKVPIKDFLNNFWNAFLLDFLLKKKKLF